MTIAGREIQIQRIWRNSFQCELDEALETRLRQSALVGVKAGLKAALVEELDAQLGFGRYVRLPRGKKALVTPSASAASRLT